MEQMIYYYTYMGLPFCGTNKVPIHADAKEKLPDTASLASRAKGLVSSNFIIASMPKQKFNKTLWPTLKGETR